jgi:hypothetical protein
LSDGAGHLRVLIANERKDRLAVVAAAVVALGHEVIAREIDVEDVGEVTARERPDVALVGLGASSEHALGLIDRIVREAACPVIVLLHAPDPGVCAGGVQARGVCAYFGRGCRGLAGVDRHRLAAVCGVSRAGGGVWSAGAD